MKKLTENMKNEHSALCFVNTLLHLKYKTKHIRTDSLYK